MMSRTHAALAVAVTSLGMGTADPLVLLVAAAASQLPDIDTSTSVPGRILWPISRYLEKRYPHRSVTHSFLATAVWAVITLPVSWLGSGFWGGLVLGFWMGWFGDVFTKQGVAAFWPSAVRLVIPGNPRFRMSTNSQAEIFVLGLLVVVSIWSFNLNSQGGILRGFNHALGFPEGAVEIVNTDGSDWQLFVKVDGRHAITQQPVKQEFEVIRSLTTSDLLVKNDQGLYYRIGSTTGSDISVNRVTTRRGVRIHSTVQTMTLADEDIGDRIRSISKAWQVYITGTLTVADAEDLHIPSLPDRFDPITLQPGSGGVAIIRLESATPEAVLNRLDGWDGSGSLVVRYVGVE